MRVRSFYKRCWVPFYSLFMREIRRFMRVFFQTIAAPLISVFLYLLIFGFSLGRQLPDIEGYPYFAFIVPGLLVMVVIRNAFDNSTGSIVTSKFVGELEDLRMVPLSSLQIAWANGLASVVRGLIVGVITYLLSAWAYLEVYEMPFPMKHPFFLLAFLVMGGISWAFLGLAISFFSRNFEHVNAFSIFVFLPMIYLGGVFFSLSNLPPEWQQVAKINPLLYLVDGVRYSILGVSDVHYAVSFSVVTLNLVVFYIIAIISLHKGSYQRW